MEPMQDRLARNQGKLTAWWKHEDEKNLYLSSP